MHGCLIVDFLNKKLAVLVLEELEKGNQLYNLLIQANKNRRRKKYLGKRRVKLKVEVKVKFKEWGKIKVK